MSVLILQNSLPENLSYTELVHEVELSNNTLAKRLISHVDKQAAYFVGEEQRKRNWAASILSNHAGEDFHADVIESLQKCLKGMNKSDIIEVIRDVIGMLSEQDIMAGHEIASILAGGSE